jgi:uncharacterized membrane protein YfcA
MAMTGVLGLLIGLALALTGAGGGVLAVPVLLFGLKLSVAQAGPVALFAVALSAAVGATLGLRAGIVRYRAAGFMAVLGMTLSPIGVWTAHQVPNAPLVGIFGLVLAWVALRAVQRARSESAARAAPAIAAGHDGPPVLGMPAASLPPGRQPPPRPLCARDPVRGRFVWTGPCTAALASCGIVTGFLSGLLGVGGGFVIVPTLCRISDLPMRSVTATSLAVITLVSASGVLYAALGGHMVWPVAVPFTTGAVAGMVAGRAIVAHVAPHRLHQTFAALAAAVAAAMLYKSAALMIG